MAQQLADSSIGTLVVGTTLTMPASTIRNVDVRAGAAIDATKLIHRLELGTELYGPTTTVAALTKHLHTAKTANETIIRFAAMVEVASTGADRTLTVDLKKAAAGVAYSSATTCLSVTVSLPFGATIGTLVDGTLSTTTMATGDRLYAVVTVGGAAGAQATGLSCSLIIDANPA